MFNSRYAAAISSGAYCAASCSRAASARSSCEPRILAARLGSLCGILALAWVPGRPMSNSKTPRRRNSLELKTLRIALSHSEASIEHRQRFCRLPHGCIQFRRQAENKCNRGLRPGRQWHFESGEHVGKTPLQLALYAAAVAAGGKTKRSPRRKGMGVVPSGLLQRPPGSCRNQARARPPAKLSSR